MHTDNSDAEAGWRLEVISVLSAIKNNQDALSAMSADEVSRIDSILEAAGSDSGQPSGDLKNISDFDFVPRNPTEYMLYAGTEGDLQNFREHALFVWQEMIKAYRNRKIAKP